MEIDNVIRKAELIKQVENPSGIDNLIQSLKSYKERVGDIKPLRHYRLIEAYPKGSLCSMLDVRLHGITEYVVRCLEKERYDVSGDGQTTHIAGFVIDVDDEDIYNYVFDVEYYKVSHKLEVELYKNGFDCTNLSEKRLMNFNKVNVSQIPLITTQVVIPV